ncbi:MAG: hypothetical protein JXX28_07675 [Deltaproteobacteria bacterium]|nr:hypothetical protein [Deltaproteobacteria bacterium]
MRRSLFALGALGLSGCLLGWDLYATCEGWCGGTAAWNGLDGQWDVLGSFPMNCSDDGRFCGYPTVMVQGAGEGTPTTSCGEVCESYQLGDDRLSCAPACSYLNDTDHAAMSAFAERDDRGALGAALWVEGEAPSQQDLSCDSEVDFSDSSQSLVCCCVSRDSLGYSADVGG